MADYRRNGTAETLLAIMNYNGGRLKQEEVRSILEVRIALDTLAATLCTDRITDRELAHLEALTRRIKDAASVDEAVGAAYEFQHEFALASGNTLIPLIFSSFKVAVSSLWERFCVLYGTDALYENTATLLDFLKNRDTQGAIDWINKSVAQSIDGNRKIYYE